MAHLHFYCPVGIKRDILLAEYQLQFNQIPLKLAACLTFNYARHIQSLMLILWKEFGHVLRALSYMCA